MPPMNATCFTKPYTSPEEYPEFGAPVLSAEDYARLREYALNDELSDELDRAIVVKKEQVPEDVVTMNTRCVYLDERLGTQREIELVFPEEADLAAGRVSVLTPVGSALIGLRVGQEIAWDFPDGSIRRLKVTGVRKTAA
ncbi:nucleoside diphosphate kinase regulator [Dechloromonas sp. ARDL1]|uniref:nucleoside diphosphate kinase regulator n=1 Tax=Dechloromonas sp. ARDL1 TaxID=3322121 RepID=UPI003DA700F9